MLKNKRTCLQISMRCSTAYRSMKVKELLSRLMMENVRFAKIVTLSTIFFKYIKHLNSSQLSKLKVKQCDLVYRMWSLNFYWNTSITYMLLRISMSKTIALYLMSFNDFEWKLTIYLEIIQKYKKAPYFCLREKPIYISL